MERMKLPIGIESFQEIRTLGFYYVDKSLLIKDLLQHWSKVNLFTRPRRFGKTLNMSMLKSFFEIGANKSLFDGLAISGEETLCAEHMGKYPVVFISLKGVGGLNFDNAYQMMCGIIAREARRFQFLKDSERLSIADKQVLIDLYTNPSISVACLKNSLLSLTEVLFKHYGKQTILLIDEYDVPLDKAFQGGYYKEMVDLVRGLFEAALKTNPNLYFAVVTGCLRISKESIFTGLNNLDINSITAKQYDEYFGFVESDVRMLLEYYGLSEHFDETREWYDGYRFGDADVYNPWDVLNHCKALLQSSDAIPQAYWDNASSNDLVKRFIDKADATTRYEIEQLISGDAVDKRVHEDITYDELDSSIENVWNVLFLTGYLTQEKTNRRYGDSQMRLVIPNREVRQMFVEKIRKWFAEKVAVADLSAFYRAFLDGNADAITTELNRQLSATISYHDAREQFYHGFLAGILNGCASWSVLNNREGGDGRYDIALRHEDGIHAVLVEVKIAASLNLLDASCEQALRQIEEKGYENALLDDGFTDIKKYGVAFYKKKCCVKTGE